METMVPNPIPIELNTWAAALTHTCNTKPISDPEVLTANHRMYGKKKMTF